MSVLSIRGLGKRFGATVALADLDLEVAAGSRTVIVGPSGSGKTTLLRLIAGFEAPDSGVIALDGTPIVDAHAGVPPHRRNIGLVMQEGALFPHLSVSENIRFGIRERRDGAAQALRLMDLVELDRGMAERQPHQLSGGQQQRVALARAMARQPRLMLLDEPFSALDTDLRETLRQATAAILAQAGIATLLVTHDRDEAMSFADQLVVLREGRLAQAGEPSALYRQPADPVTAAFLGEALILDAQLGEGMAHGVLGALPLGEAQWGRRGAGRVMLRPEQLVLLPGEAEDWTVWASRFAGGVSRLTLRRDGEVLSFETHQPGLPEVGAKVRVRVHGPVWAFG